MRIQYLIQILQTHQDRNNSSVCSLWVEKEMRWSAAKEKIKIIRYLLKAVWQ